MTSVSAGHIILTPTQPVGSGRSQRESNPGPPHQESRALYRLSYPPPLFYTPPPPHTQSRCKIRVYEPLSRDFSVLVHQAYCVIVLFTFESGIYCRNIGGPKVWILLTWGGGGGVCLFVWFLNVLVSN